MRQPRSDEAIRLGAQGKRGREREGINWGLIRAVYMRILALAWLGKGLYAGATIIGLFGPTFQTLSGTDQASVAFSTIGDCIAGVGLWLTVDWGAVTWIAVVLVEMAFAFNAGAEMGLAVSMLAPVLFYLVITVIGARQYAERD
jgi:hypothetical protein